MTATGWARTSRGVVLASVLALAGCGDNDAKTPARTSSATQPSRPEPVVARRQTLQYVVYARLRRVDPRADNTEHAALDDAHAQAKFGQDRVQIDVYAPDLPPTGRALKTERYKGVKATLRRESSAVAYWSKCEMEGFGRKTVVLRYVDAPVRTVPAVHRALRCRVTG